MSEIGRVVKEEWNRTIEVRSGVKLDAFVIMPNHLHGILILSDDWATHRVAPTKPLGPKAGSIGAIVGQFKSIVSKRAAIPSIWQRNYYDRIIRTEKELNLTRLYILANPLMWNWDPNNQEGELPASIDDALIKQCGFSPEDYELIGNYVEYRKMR